MFDKLFNKWICRRFFTVAGILSTVFSIAIIFIREDRQIAALIVLIALLIISYAIIVICANLKKKVHIKIRNTKIIVKEGDLFQEQGLKVIPVNEFFDVDIENGIIDPNTLHGQYISRHSGKQPEELYNDIVTALNNRRLEATDQNRPSGKQLKYKLGTIYNDRQGFLLLAYSSFDNDNRARLSNYGIVQCYTNMWNEIDIVRGTNSIVFPLLGAGGIVRFDKMYTPQQLIELMLWSFRISGIQLSRNATLTIVVHKSVAKEIDFLKLTNYAD